MAEPKVCVSLEGTTVKEMADEAARANLAGADFVEVRFDRLYLKKPEAQPVEDENGEVKHVMPPESEWIERSMEDLDVDESIQSLKESIPLPVIFTVRPKEEEDSIPEAKRIASAYLQRPSPPASTPLTLNSPSKRRPALGSSMRPAKPRLTSSLPFTTP